MPAARPRTPATLLPPLPRFQACQKSASARRDPPSRPAPGNAPERHPASPGGRRPVLGINVPDEGPLGPLGRTKESLPARSSGRRPTTARRNGAVRRRAAPAPTAHHAQPVAHLQAPDTEGLAQAGQHPPSGTRQVTGMRPGGSSSRASRQARRFRRKTGKRTTHPVRKAPGAEGREALHRKRRPTHRVIGLAQDTAGPGPSKPRKEEMLFHEGSRGWGDGSAWQSATQPSALRYSRFIHTGLGWRRAMASTKTSGSRQAKAATTTCPGSTPERRPSDGSPRHRPAGKPVRHPAAPGVRRCTQVVHPQTHGDPCSAASWRANRQHTPMSPKLSTGAKTGPSAPAGEQARVMRTRRQVWDKHGRKPDRLYKALGRRGRNFINNRRTRLPSLVDSFLNQSNQ